MGHARTLLLFSWLLVLTLFAIGSTVVQAQTGSVVWFTATAGTTIANCPASPAEPSLCMVATGFFAWQNATQGWFLVSPPTPAVTGVTGIIVCNETATNCGTAQTGTVSLNIPKTATLN